MVVFYSSYSKHLSDIYLRPSNATELEDHKNQGHISPFPTQSHSGPTTQDLKCSTSELIFWVFPRISTSVGYYWKESYIFWRVCCRWWHFRGKEDEGDLQPKHFAP